MSETQTVNNLLDFINTLNIWEEKIRKLLKLIDDYSSKRDMVIAELITDKIREELKK